MKQESKSEEIERKIKILIGSQKKYHLRIFRPILYEIFSFYENMEAMQGVNILELGPGTKVNLLRFFAEQSGAGLVEGIGRIPQWLYFPGRKATRNYVQNSYILPALKNIKATLLV